MEVGRPSQKSQPSRKGKKAWRKNIDIDDVHEGLDKARDFEREYGSKDVADISGKDLFTVDIEGDQKLKNAKTTRQLKADEILNRRSAVPALATQQHKIKKDSRVSKKKLETLLRKAGKSKDLVSSDIARIEDDGLVHSKSYDVWGTPPKSKKDTTASFIQGMKGPQPYTKAERAPETLKRAPLRLVEEGKAKAIMIPDGGRSYNPSIEAWQELLQREYEREKEREEERLETEKLAAKIQSRITFLQNNQKDEASVSDDDEEGKSDSDVANSGLSVNPPVKVKTKTQRQRNKEKRNKEQEELSKQLKLARQRIKDLEVLSKYLNEMDANSTKPQKSNSKIHSRHGRHRLADSDLEIKLSDELTDCLRRLRPEGNLLKDRFRSLQERGLIEVTIPVKKSRRYKKKVVEKASFKAIKLHNK